MKRKEVRLSACINWQRLICLKRKPYSIYPGRASGLWNPGEPWPVQCQRVLTTEAQSSELAVLADCPSCLVLACQCQGVLVCLTLRMITLLATFLHDPSRITTATCKFTKMEAPQQSWVHYLGILGPIWTADGSTAIWLLICKITQSETFARKWRSPSLVLLATSIWLSPSRRQPPLTST